MKQFTVTSSNWKILALNILAVGYFKNKLLFAKRIRFISPKIINMVKGKKLKSQGIEMNVSQYDRTENAAGN